MVEGFESGPGIEGDEPLDLLFCLLEGLLAGVREAYPAFEFLQGFVQWKLTSFQALHQVFEFRQGGLKGLQGKGVLVCHGGAAHGCQVSNASRTVRRGQWRMAVQPRCRWLVTADVRLESNP